MSRIEAKFSELASKDKKAFIPYITAGDPNLETTASLIIELERSGADVIELGVPFSDPMADGPVIQRASERALKNGTSVRDCLDLVRRVREKSDIPIILFSYFNPLLALGFDAMGQELRNAGIDGVLVTDLVPEEAMDFVRNMRDAAIDTIFLVAPTSTDDRIRLIAEYSSGFIYAVSRTGVTGVRHSLSEAAASLAQRVRTFTELPVAVGFGVSTAEQVSEVWQHADAAVVGSRIVSEIENYTGKPDLVERVGALTRLLVSRRG
jgi:tryptophan synthase alpha chain